jgi:hypothetical protein
MIPYAYFPSDQILGRVVESVLWMLGQHDEPPFPTGDDRARVHPSLVGNATKYQWLAQSCLPFVNA